MNRHNIFHTFLASDAGDTAGIGSNALDGGTAGKTEVGGAGGGATGDPTAPPIVSNETGPDGGINAVSSSDGGITATAGSGGAANASGTPGGGTTGSAGASDNINSEN